MCCCVLHNDDDIRNSENFEKDNLSPLNGSRFASLCLDEMKKSGII